MDNMTQQSWPVEQASAAAQAMNEQAAGLAQIVSVFKVGAAAAVPRSCRAAAGAFATLTWAPM
jgi:methyl-accepting chemotaxis protein